MGNIIEKTIVARTMRTLGTLISSGVPILEALAIVRETCMNAVFERMYQRVYESIREGDTIAQPLKESRLVDDMVVNMIDVGEETGDLDTMLNKIADVYDEEVDVLVESADQLAGADHDRRPRLHRRHHRHRAVHAADQAAGRVEQVIFPLSRLCGRGAGGKGFGCFLENTAALTPTPLPQSRERGTRVRRFRPCDRHEPDRPAGPASRWWSCWWSSRSSPSCSR